MGHMQSCLALYKEKARSHSCCSPVQVAVWQGDAKEQLQAAGQVAIHQLLKLLPGCLIRHSICKSIYGFEAAS